MFENVTDFKMNGAGRNKDAFIDDERDVVFTQTTSAVNMRWGTQTDFLLRLGAGRAQKGGNVYYVQLLRTSENGKSIQNIDVKCINWGNGAVKSDPDFLKDNTDYIKDLIFEAIQCLQGKWPDLYEHAEFRFNRISYDF